MDAEQVFCTAIKEGKMQVVKDMIDNGIDFARIDRVQYVCALYDAAFSSHVNVVAHVMECDDYMCENVLEDAAKHGNVEFIKIYIRKKYCSPSLRDILLSIAAEHGKIDVVAFMYENGADINSFRYNRSVEIAAENGHLDVLAFLVKHGADMSELQRSIYIAAKHGHMDVVSFLVNHAHDKHDVFNGLQWMLRDGNLQAIQAALMYKSKLAHINTKSFAQLLFYREIGHCRVSLP